jgi:hypothetical protein
MNSYPLGNAVKLSVTFLDATTLIPADPTTVKLRVRDPAGTETDYVGLQVIRASAGNYSFVVATVTPGIWKYRWEGSGIVVAAAEKHFEVQPSSFEPD